QPRRRSANQRAIESVLSPSVREQKNENPRPNPPIRGRRSPPTDGCGVTTHMWIKASLVSVSLALAGVDNLSVRPEVKPSDVQFGNTTVNWKQRTLRFLARKQEGSLKGHNPRRHGRPSHHPLVAVLGEAHFLLHGWLRSGNCGTARGAEEFLKEALALWGQRQKIRLLRADSGFFDGHCWTIWNSTTCPTL